MTPNLRKDDRIEKKVENGTKRGLADIEAGRFNVFSPSYAEALAAKFKARFTTQLR